MKMVKDYIGKIFFIFKEIYKAGVGVFVLSIASMLLTGLSPVLITYLTAKLLELIGMSATKNQQINPIEFLLPLLGVIGLVIISFAIENMKTVICSVVGLRLSHNLENTIAEKFQMIKRQRLDNPDFRDLHTNTITACGTEPLNLMESLFGLVANAISIVGYGMIVIRFNWIAFAVIVVTVIPTLIIKKKYQGMMFKFYSSHTMQMRRIWYFLSLITEVENANEIRSYRLFPYYMGKRKEEFKSYIKENSKIAAKEITFTLITNLIAMMGTIIVGAWLIKSVLSGSIKISLFYLSFTAITTFVTKLLVLSGQIASTSKCMMFIDYIFKYFAEKDLIVEGEKRIQEKDVHNIKFENVSYKYEGSDVYALKNISVSFNTDETICLVGENGSGKSTFSKLLTGIYEPTEGNIYIDGINIKDYKIDELRKFFGVLYQDYIKFADTVSNCIGVGNLEEIDDRKGIAEAAEVTGASQFINDYSEKYETHLSKLFYNEAIEPSGGQWQKLALTRALFSKGKVLVLDEPTAALDPKSEVKMADVFKRIKGSNSTVIISHRMYMTKIADKILVLNKGSLIENDSFENLIKSKNEFYSMYKLQSDSYKMSI